MCGIAGFFQNDSRLGEAHLQKMTDIQAHRGPDAGGYYFNGSTGLGHRRLSIIDLSTAANQPMTSHDGKAKIIFNGEIYNFRELSKELGLNWHTNSDTEVLLEAYMKWGNAFVHRLNGMFAMAIFNEEDNSLFICRDRMGIKPLYYAWDGSLLLFSSELKGILSLRPELKFTLNRKAVKDYLLLGYVPEPLSICNEIKKFPSGSYGLLKNGEFSMHSFWQPESLIEKEVLSDEIQAKEQLKKLINSSVRYRMVSDVPFGTFLSGGIDSSLVTAVAQHNSDEPINTFSIGFQDSKYNESDFARSVASYLGTHHHEFTVNEQDAIESIERMISSHDEPFADSSAIPTMLVSELARKHVTMTLSGDGGDELFLGYGTYKWARRLSNPLVKLLRRPVHRFLASRESNRFKRAAELFNYSDDSRLPQHIFSQEIYYFSESEIEQIFINEPPAESFGYHHHGLKRRLNSMEMQALFDIRYYLKDDLLTKVDRASMQFSLEARVPLLDYRIVEFALNLDPALKFRNGESKYLLKKVLYDYVPEKFFKRPKWGFSIPLERWLSKDLNYLIDQYCNAEICAKYGLIRHDVLQGYLNQFRQGRNYFYNRIWQIIVLHKSLEKVGLD